MAYEKKNGAHLDVGLTIFVSQCATRAIEVIETTATKSNYSTIASSWLIEL